MSDILPQLLKEDELERETAIDADTKIQCSEQKNEKEKRLDVLRTLLKKRRERESTTRRTVNEELLSEKNGQDSIVSGSEKLGKFGVNVECPENLPHTGESQTERPSNVANMPIISVQPSVLPEPSSSNTSPTSEIIESQLMSLLDESANHMFDLMKGLHSNQPAAEVKAYDPDRVNSAVNCANTIYKIMRLKLDAIKVQRKLK